MTWAGAAENETAQPETPAAAKLDLQQSAHKRPRVGVALCVHHIGDLPLYLRSIDEIVKLGANALIIVTPWYQEFADSTTIRHIQEKCPTDEQLLSLLAHARCRGLHTTLLPIVLIKRPGEKDWRGTIRPKDWDAWWTSYIRFIDHFLDLSLAARVDALSMGSELNTTEDQIDRWDHIAQRIRARFNGELTYSANWDRYEKVRFWPLVDVISVSAYFELERDDPHAAQERLVRAWQPIRESLLECARQNNRPLLLSEIGYPTLSTAAARPWDYVARPDSKPDHEAQARAWSAFFQAWSPDALDPNVPWLGFNCYRWDPYYAGESDDFGYGVQGKPAYDIISNGFAELRDTSLPTSRRARQEDG